MESNSVAHSRTKISHYKFFNNSDLVKLLNYFITIFESYGNFSEQGMVLKKETLDYHILDIFNLSRKCGSNLPNSTGPIMPLKFFSEPKEYVETKSEKLASFSSI